MIQSTIFELMEGLKVFYKYDGSPEIYTCEGVLAIQSKKFLKIKEIDENKLIELRWTKCKVKNEHWSLRI